MSTSGLVHSKITPGRFTAKFDEKTERSDNIIEVKEDNKTITYIVEDDFIIKLLPEHPDLPALVPKLINKNHSSYMVSEIYGNVDSFDEIKLASDAKRVYEEPNAGGNSIESEALSLEFFKRCWNCCLKETEMEIGYCPQSSKKTDYSILFLNHAVGISVTRAFAFKGNFKEKDADRLLKKKMIGIIESSRNVVKKSKWIKQILHIFTPTTKNERLIKKAYDKLSKELKSNTVVVVTVTNMTLPFIYSQNWRFSANLNYPGSLELIDNI